jgi:predicted ATPase
LKTEDGYVAGNPDFADSPMMIVLSGCSGSGKSSLLAELSRRGFDVQPEAGRQIVREQMLIGGPALPWADAAAFIELAASRAMWQFNVARPTERPVIFDRSLVDLVSYFDYRRLAVPAHLATAMKLYRYAPQVFVTPPWREIYVDDGERKKSFEDAVAEYDVLIRWYRREGYDIVEIPPAEISVRADFFEDAVRGLK